MRSFSKTLALPPPDNDIRREYRQLVLEIDLCVQDLTTGRLAGFCKCRPGCSACCMAFSVLPLEAALLAEALVGQAESSGQQDERCIFLRDDLCSLYAWRSVICRTQGMALAYIDEATQTIEVSACPHNFPDDVALEHDDLLFMDPFNERLADLNLRYCRQNSLVPEHRFALADLFSWQA